MTFTWYTSPAAIRRRTSATADGNGSTFGLLVRSITGLGPKSGGGTSSRSANAAHHTYGIPAGGRSAVRAAGSNAADASYAIAMTTHAS